MVTVGYGHAEKFNKSKIKVGQKITQQQADEFLKDDLKVAADGVRRMFKDWENEDVVVPITQNMFDALVSMAFNAGVGGLRRSDVAKHLKKGDYTATADSIKTFKVSERFPGLAIRRDKESKMFLASI
jgi:lysozyme